MATRDADILKEIARLLDATGKFSAVHVYAPEEYQADGADATSLAFVEPVSWNEDTDGDDHDGPRERRDVSWRLTLVVREDSPTRRIERIDLLESVAANALNGISYLGQTVAALSRLTGGRYLPSVHPFRAMGIVGEFVTLLDGYAGNDATDDIDNLL